MNKREFLTELRRKLSGLPTSETEERISFYGEMIDDLIEEGISEAEAIEKIGPVEKLAEQILSEIPLIKLAGERIKPKRRLKAWEIVLLILGAPLWLSLMIAVFAIILAAYVSIWAVVISFWAVFVSLIAVALCGIGVGAGLIWNNHILSAFLLIGTSFVCAGLSVFCFYGCKAATKGIILLAKKIIFGIKNSFMKRKKTA